MIPYRQIAAEALEHEAKAHRDQVLARYPDQAAGSRHLMDGLARRLATSVQYAAEVRRRGRKPPERLTQQERIEIRRQALERIEPPWLRARVEAIVRERFATEKQRLKALQEAVA